jgi:hypothetical protein
MPTTTERTIMLKLRVYLLCLLMSLMTTPGVLAQATPSVQLLIGYGCPLTHVATTPVQPGQAVTIIGYECAAVPIQAIVLTFSSTDPLAIVPAPLVFPGGRNVVLGTVRFFTPGLQVITASDVNVGISASAPVIVASPVPANSLWMLLSLAVAMATIATMGAAGFMAWRQPKSR